MRPSKTIMLLLTLLGACARQQGSNDMSLESALPVLYDYRQLAHDLVVSGLEPGVQRIEFDVYVPSAGWISWETAGEILQTTVEVGNAWTREHVRPTVTLVDREGKKDRRRAIVEVALTSAGPWVISLTGGRLRRVFRDGRYNIDDPATLPPEDFMFFHGWGSTVIRIVGGCQVAAMAWIERDTSGTATAVEIDFSEALPAEGLNVTFDEGGVTRTDRGTASGPRRLRYSFAGVRDQTGVLTKLRLAGGALSSSLKCEPADVSFRVPQAPFREWPLVPFSDLHAAALEDIK